MTSSNGNIFRVTGPLCGEFTGHRWIPLTKASDAELWCFLWSAPWINGWVNNREAGELRHHRAHYDVIVMKSRTVSIVSGIHCTLRISDWLENVYFRTYLSRLKESWRYAEHRLTKMGVKCHPAQAAYFIWADFTKVCVSSILNTIFLALSWVTATYISKYGPWWLNLEHCAPDFYNTEGYIW